MATIRGGKKLEAALRELAKHVDRQGTLKVGFLEGATYPDGTSVAAVAAFNEYGASGPPRPFFRIMIRKESKLWPQTMAAILKATDFDVEATLDQMGQLIKAQLQSSIQQLTAPPLSPLTIRRKGHDKPLIDTGHMLNSVDYVVNVT